MEISAILGLPYIQPSQAQKHVTHNEAIRTLDTIVQLSVADRDLTAPPSSPGADERFLVAAPATGAWAGHDGDIAIWHETAWAFTTPRSGWVAWIEDESLLLVHDGNGWQPISEPSSAPLFGINATADATNRLTVKSDAALFSHDDVTPGNGSMQIKLNKDAAGDTGSVLFQTGWSGRAEMGLTGDDAWHLKVSPDGTNWSEALVADDAGVALGGVLRLGQFTVATLPTGPEAQAGAVIFVSDETGGPVPAFHDGSDWRRVTDRAVVS